MKTVDRQIRRLALIGLALTGGFLGGCEPAPGDGDDGVEGRQGAVRLDTAVRSDQFGGNGRIDEKHCSFGPFNCTRIVGWAAAFDLPAQGRLRELWVWSGSYVDGLEAVWQSESDPQQIVHGPHIGGWGGELTKLLLAPDEAIVGVKVKSGQLVDSLQVVTNKFQVMRWGGDGGGAWLKVALPPGNEVHGFNGLHDQYLHKIGFWSYVP